jgi:DNA ligase (NAD+)
MRIRATAKNRKGKIEKNQKVKQGYCIFPFKHKFKEHEECIDTEKGEICATEINEKTRTLVKYGYCQPPTPKDKTPSPKAKTPSPTSLKKRTEKKALSIPKTKKLKIVPKLKSPSQKEKTLKTRKLKKKIKLIERLKKTPDISQQREMTPKQKTYNEAYNEEFVKILEELDSIMTRQGEPFRAKAYRQAADAIMRYPNDITDPKQLENVKGIGKTIMTKLEEYVETGTLKVLERERNNPLNVLTKVYGIGPKKAKDFIDKGIKTIDDLRLNMDKLTSAQKLGVQYYDDIELRIPREEIDLYKKEFKEVIDEAPRGSKFEIVGSYRRGANTSGDIDVIITNEENNQKVFDFFIDKLMEKKIILHILSRGKTKSLTISRLGDEFKARRLDLMYSPPDEYAFATLYFTGSKAFNTMQRQRALDLGYTLNEHGFHKMTDKTKGDKITQYFPDEKSIFTFLGMKYKEPKERIDARSIELLTPQAQPQPKASPETQQQQQAEPQSKQEVPKIRRKTLKIVKQLKPSLSQKQIDLIEQFKKEGISYLKTLTEKQLEDMIKQANNAYYNNQTPIMTDNEYDILREYTLDKYPDNIIAQEQHTGIDVVKNKVKLPYEMWSMDKIKPDTNALEKWKQTYKGPYVLSCKVDGVSALYSTEGSEPKLYTRGNGIVGQDVSHLIPFLRLPKEKGIVIRGEFIISKNKFKENYSKEFSNPRNFVAGLVNQKKIMPDKMRDLEFVAYEVIKPILKPSEQMVFLNELNIETVQYLVSSKVTNELLSTLLVSWREEYKYEIDGVICMNDEIYPRITGNPEHAFAFKMVLGDQLAEAKVVDVIWTASKDGYLKPRVQIEPVVLGGARIEYATGFNAKFIVDNKIGVGSVIKLVRSGDVIPHIVSVIEPASQPLMPNVEYKWNETNVDILLQDTTQDETVKEKVITGFFKGIGVEGLSIGNVRRIISAGFDTVPKILSMKKEDFLTVEGFKEKLATKIKDGIEKQIDKASLPELMNATNIFGRGFGEKRIKSILEEYPDILVSTLPNTEKIANVEKISGMAKKTANKFVENIPEFVEWAKQSNLQDRLVYISKKQTSDKDGQQQQHELTGKKYVMTGFRDKELVAKLEAIGAIQAASVSKNTFVVLVKDKDETTGKAEEARKLNIPLMTPEEFVERFNI